MIGGGSVGIGGDVCCTGKKGQNHGEDKVGGEERHGASKSRSEQCRVLKWVRWLVNVDGAHDALCSSTSLST